MAIPSEEDLKDYVETLESIQANEIAKEIYYNRDKSVEFLEVLVRSAVDDLESKLNTAKCHPVDEWLQNNPEFKRSEIRLMYHGRGEPNPSDWSMDDWIVKAAKRIRQYDQKHKNEFEQDGPDATENRELKKYLRSRFGKPLYTKWRQGFIEAFIEYRHTDNAKEISECRKMLPKAVSDATTAIKNLDALIRNNFSRHNDIINFSLLSDCVGEILHALENRYPPEISKKYPIKRNSALATRRLFVFRMVHIHWLNFGRPKPEVIGELLMIEGISSPMETRAIKRDCAEFIAKFKSH